MNAGFHVLWAQVKEQSRNAPVFPAGQMLPFVLVSLIFFLWGMSNNLTDILQQQFKKSFELNVLAGSVGLGCGSSWRMERWAIPAGLFMRKLGYKAGILTGSARLRNGDCAVSARGVPGAISVCS